MGYTVTCQCGATIAVSATQAGITLACRCGRSVGVPSLSRLRQQAGEGPYPRNIPETIAAMIESGELPAGDFCAVSGFPTKDTLLLDIQCERKWVRGSRSNDLEGVVFWWLLFGWLGALIAYDRAARPYEELGRETRVRVPLRVRADYQPRVRRASQRKLRKLLRTVPVYADLLREYPGSVVTVVDR